MYTLLFSFGNADIITSFARTMPDVQNPGSGDEQDENVSYLRNSLTRLFPRMLNEKIQIFERHKPVLCTMTGFVKEFR